MSLCSPLWHPSARLGGALRASTGYAGGAVQHGGSAPHLTVADAIGKGLRAEQQHKV